MPGSRRPSRAAAAADTTERSLAMRILLYSPKDLAAGLVAVAAVAAIAANALFMQAGHHPSPMFGVPVSVSMASPLPRPGAVEATLKPADIKVIDPGQI